MTDTITVKSSTQVIRVDPATGHVAVIMAGPAGPGSSDPSAVKLTGDQTVSGEKTWQNDTQYTIDHPDDGTVHAGVIRSVQSIQIPWEYTQTNDPTDPAIGTAVNVQAQVAVDGFDGLDGANFATGLFGPRGVFEFEGLIRYGVDMSIVSIAPIGYADISALANDDGNDRVLTPSWTFMSARQYIAQAGVVTLEENDTNSGGAAFIATPLWGTTDVGEIDGLTNQSEDTGFLFGGLYAGNVDMKRRIGVDIKGAMKMADIAFPDIIEPGELYPDWTGAGVGALGTVDADVATIEEEIGLRVRKFSLGATKIGLRTAHPIQLLSEDLTHAAFHTLIGVKDGNTRVLTLTGDNAAGVSAYTFDPTIVFEDNGFLFGSMLGFVIAPLVKNVNGETRQIGVSIGYHAAPKWRGDGAALTVLSFTAFSDQANSDIVSSGTVAYTAHNGLVSAPTVGTGVTMTTRKAVDIQDVAGSGTLTTNIGIDIAGITKGATNIGLRNASTEVATPGQASLSNASSTIQPVSKVRRLNNLSGGALTLTATPIIPDGQDGQLLIIFNGSANSVTLTHGTANNLRLDGGTNKTLATRASIVLMFSSTIGDWIQIGSVVTPT